jgi:alkanesulfonate monooxygenase SsuD/methylene tetrahydromethanopterin reductase-like flavin-dependent oxidoreductase (luciferase family)
MGGKSPVAASDEQRVALAACRFQSTAATYYEPLITFAYLAGITKNLEMATGVIILPQRQTVLFAKQAADVDLFSDGRLRLGVGVGWNWVEYDGLEMSGHFRRRSKRQEQ